MHSPLPLTDLVTPALDGIAAALSGRGGQTEEQRRTCADQARMLILSFQPRDTIDLTLSGQTVLFNELIADGARDVLSGLASPQKARAISGIVALGRLVQGHIDRLDRRAPRSAPAPAADVAVPAEPAVHPEPAEDTASWLEQPWEQWLVETPAEEADRLAAEAQPAADPPAEPGPMPQAPAPVPVTVFQDRCFPPPGGGYVGGRLPAAPPGMLTATG